MEISPKTADTLYTLANYGLILGILLTAIATIVQVWMAKIKDEYQQVELAQADLRIQQANEAGAKAREAAEQATVRAEMAAAELRKFKAPREIPVKQREHIVRAISTYSGQEYTAVLGPAGFDVRQLWNALNEILSQAGWKRVEPAGLASGSPPAGIAIEPTPGIIITIDRSAYNQIGSAAEALAEAINKTGLAAKIMFGRDPKEKRLDVITLRIGPKPQ